MRRRSQGFGASSPLDKLEADSGTGLACREWLEMSRLFCWLLCRVETSTLPCCVLKLEERDARLSSDSRICLKKNCMRQGRTTCERQ